MIYHQHLRAWFTPSRLKLIRCATLDVLAGRPVGTLSRFLAGAPHVTLTSRGGLASYYPPLLLLGYQPPIL